MTPVLMQFLTSTGAPIGFANVEIRLTRSDYEEQVSGIIMPRLVNAVTGLDGKALVSLMPCSTRYHVTVYDTVSEAALHYHFYVPTINNEDGGFLRLQDLIVDDDVVLSPVAYDEATLITMLAAKATTLVAKDAALAAAATAEAASQFADDAIMATVDARNAAQTAALQAQVSQAAVESHIQNAHDDALLAEDRAAAALQARIDALAAASASLASATAAATKADAAAQSAYEADQSEATAIAARDAATTAAVSTVSARDATLAARDATTTARDNTYTARDVAISARDTAVQKAAQLSSQLAAFNEIYIGKFAVAPTVDGNGGVLKVGAIYENTVEGKIYQWESDLAWHAYDEETTLQLNNATLAASNAAASATAALAAETYAEQARDTAQSHRDAASGFATTASNAATAASASKDAAAGSATAADTARATAVGAKDTATQKAADAAQSAADAAASATLATSGQVQSDWTQADAANKGFIKNKPLLSAVATSGAKADVGLGNVDNTPDAAKPVSTAQATAIGAKLDAALKNVLNGFVGLTNYIIDFRSSSGTFLSGLYNANTAVRMYLFPDKDGTVAMTSDITGTNSGVNTGDETAASIRTKVGATALTGSNTGDETNSTILTKLGIPSISGTNTGDETGATIRTKLGATVVTGSNTGDETQASILSKLGATAVTGSNTGDESQASILTKLGATAVTGSNTGDQTLASLGIPNVNNTSDAAKPVSTAQQAALDLKANITYVDTKVAALVNSSPAALDTLNEFATALNNDPAFATTTATSLGNRLRVDADQGLSAGQQAQGRSNLNIQIGDILQARNTITSEDWNTFLVNGVYRVSNGSGANMAPGYSFGTLVVFAVGNSVTQTYYPHQNHSGLVRTKWNDLDFSAWRNLVDSTNLNAYAPTLNGTGATGTWPISITGTAANATTLGGLPLGTPGNGQAWGYVPRVAADGVMEIGRYIDMHSSSADGGDYSTRLEALPGELYINGYRAVVNNGTWGISITGIASGADTVKITNDEATTALSYLTLNRGGPSGNQLSQYNTGKVYVKPSTGELFAGGFVVTPNSMYGKSLFIGGAYNGGGNQASICVTNGNVHIDPTPGSSYATYLNFYSGTAGVKFGDGLQNITATVSAGGAFTGTNFIGPGTGLTGTAASLTAGLANKLQFVSGAAGGANFNWSGLGGQPNWLWGGNASDQMYVYNPSNFSVDNAAKLGTVTAAQTMQKRRDRVGNGGPSMAEVSGGPAEYGFTYPSDGSFSGPFMQFGGLGASNGNYNAQFSLSYNDGNGFRFRVKNDDTGAMNPWRDLWHTGNMNPPAVGATPNSTVQRTANGYIEGSYIYMTDDGNPGSGPGAVTSIISKQGDNYYRSTTAAKVKTFLSYGGNEILTYIGDYGADIGVSSMLRWKNYGNGHVIFDASNSTSPTGSAVNNTDSAIAWSGSFPTLMGWNGSQTYGVRVDCARRADAASNSDQLGGRVADTNGTANTIAQRDVNGSIIASGFYGGGGGLTGTASSLTAGSANGLNSTALNTANLWTANQQFRSNRGSGTYGRDYTDYALQAFSSDGGTAALSLHRGGSYATNISLDPDNCIRFAGWSATAADKFIFNMGSGDLWAKGNVTAYSDERLKTNWRELGNDFVERWAQVTHGIYDRVDSGERQVGLGARSVRSVLPDTVTRDANGYLSLAYGNAAAVATVKLAQRCVELEDLLRGAIARIEQLEQKVGN